MLYGNRSEIPEGTVIHLCEVELSVSLSEVSTHIPSEVQDLIQQFVELFEVPTELPPPRACDHSIPLIEGAAPVQVRPYRYAPKLKDEIEKQIKEMLTNGLIHKISSPFSSSVSLVKKKDITWHFCVDYRI
jgi:tRNA A37 N6-isopentenylltransferase MiaA